MIELRWQTAEQLEFELRIADRLNDDRWAQAVRAEMRSRALRQSRLERWWNR